MGTLRFGGGLCIKDLSGGCSVCVWPEAVDSGQMSEQQNLLRDGAKK